MINGHSVGAAVTSATLCDYVLASSSATFHTPFRKLGVTPEGCSSVTFRERFGTSFADRMLNGGDKVTATEALAVGMVDEIVSSPESLQARGQVIAEEWAAAGRRRRSIEAGQVERLVEINRAESDQLAAALISPQFFEIQMNAATAKKSHGMAWLFWALGLTQPLWSKL